MRGFLCCSFVLENNMKKLKCIVVAYSKGETSEVIELNQDEAAFRYFFLSSIWADIKMNLLLSVPIKLFQYLNMKYRTDK